LHGPLVGGLVGFVSLTIVVVVVVVVVVVIVVVVIVVVVGVEALVVVGVEALVVGVEVAAAWLVQPLPAVGTIVSASITSWRDDGDRRSPACTRSFSETVSVPGCWTRQTSIAFSNDLTSAWQAAASPRDEMPRTAKTDTDDNTPRITITISNSTRVKPRSPSSIGEEILMVA
jgi:hypothetical protein